MENEREIIARWKKGDKKAFEDIVRHFMTEAFLIAYGFVGNREDARDLSQDAFVKAFQARESFDPDKPFYPWFYKILKNHCLNHLKRHAKGHESLYQEDKPGRERFASVTPTPLESLEKEERHKLLRIAIGRLSPEHREVIILKNFKSYSYAEIAEILEIPIGTVMSRLYYARKVLKDIILELEKTGIPGTGHLLAEGHPAPGEVV
ncbi:MAG: sigma-70 family RNA polymerase sigma factor [Candidatus Latescibacteria bacterium]|nr:sigma-70 family RNA polymerase sigma factor [Candidatus Latescibacterota bacterium]NIO27251.1 sigma-70 family RNA polymerase sigma factor [Candidatus Latescibacterota bacterium]NIO54775.1 sigma-70 family RNA polymerase sigma factor [Candidatus Latescibacterota bacterium]NIT00858.1 sigma-70 family RNA polymerase sigma factor [Candidatus Latescibacterota bacterium]NIT37781.1 sigma-70 family RNA polymerase sigma factor [Candidatus Latescibacterota bacterium]